MLCKMRIDRKPKTHTKIIISSFADKEKQVKFPQGVNECYHLENNLKPQSNGENLKSYSRKMERKYLK